jgi:hypothetical protein
MNKDLARGLFLITVHCSLITEKRPPSPLKNKKINLNLADNYEPV